MLSVAPLIGSEAYIDSTHKRWLHIRVRPNARGMLKTIRVGTSAPKRLSPSISLLVLWPRLSRSCLSCPIMLDD